MSLAKTASAALALVAASAPAFAAERSVVVSAQGDAATVYANLERAARRVCDTGGRNTLQNFLDAQACRSEVLSRAVADAKSEELQALHAEPKGEPTQRVIAAR